MAEGFSADIYLRMPMKNKFKIDGDFARQLSGTNRRESLKDIESRKCNWEAWEMIKEIASKKKWL